MNCTLICIRTYALSEFTIYTLYGPIIIRVCVLRVIRLYVVRAVRARIRALRARIRARTVIRYTSYGPARARIRARRARIRARTARTTYNV